MVKKYGICGLCFHSPGCGVVVHFDNQGKIQNLEPDPEAPLGKVLCPIADSVSQVVYSESRLKTPLKRVGPKGTHDFEPITWEDAYQIITDKLLQIKDQYGPESLGFYAGTGSYERSFKDIFQLKGSEIYLASSIFFPLGSPNTFGVGAPCYTSLGVLAPKLTMGCRHIDMFSDIDNSELVLVWGTDPSTSTPPVLYEQLKNAAEDGAQIIVIDPRKTPSADLDGAEWITIRPGSDGALALGLAHVLIDQELYDNEFVENWTLGFDEFQDYVSLFTPEYVSQITGIDEETIVWLAEEIAEAEGASYVMYTGLEYTKSGVQNIRAVMVLWALAGQLDVEGGRCFLRKENFLPISTDRQLETPGFEKSIGKDQFTVYSHFCGGEPHAMLLPESLINGNPYKIRSLIVLGASLMTAWPEPDIWKKAMESLDFMVTIDLQMTADAAYADLVLPATTAFEQESYCYYGNSIRFREKMIEPVGKAKPSYQILAELSRHLGYGDLYPQTTEELLNYILKASGYTFDDLLKAEKHTLKALHHDMVYKKWEKGLLRSDKKPGFETESGKLEIKSLILEKYGYEGLPKYDESDETPVSNPKLFKRYPLILGTGPFKPDMKSCLKAIPDFMEKYPYPAVEINTDDAVKRKIKTGDVVTLKSPRGSVKMRAFVTDKIMPGFAYAPVGGGGPLGTEEWKEANINCLTDMKQFDPISGFPIYKTLLCQIKKKRVRRNIKVQDPSLGCSG